jgi:hypothetical protein
MGAMMTRPTKSGLWYRQAIGRVLRRYPAPQGERKYQRDALVAVWNGLKKGILNQLLVMPTGTGKTNVTAKFPPMLSAWKMDRPRGRLMFLVHRDELAFQTADTFARYNSTLKIGIEKADSYAGDADIVVASIQTIGPSITNRIKVFNRAHFDCVITDEAHWGLKSILHANVYQHFGITKGLVNRDPGILHLGMTATPNRADNLGLEKHYDEIVYVYPLLDAIQDGWLSRIVAYRSETTVDISKVTVRGDDFTPGALDKEINTPERNELVARKYLEVCDMEGMNIQQWTPPTDWKKEHAVVVDFADLSGRHSLISVPTLFGLRGRFNAKGKDLLQQAEKIEKIRQEHPNLDLQDAPDMEAIEATLRSVDLLAPPNVPPEIQKHSKFGWLTDGPGAYHLGLMDHKVLTVRQNVLGQWEIYEHSRGVANHLWTAKEFKEALQLAEKNIPLRDVPVLRSTARWKTDPPTERQAGHIWNLDIRVRREYANPAAYYRHCSDRYRAGDNKYTKGSLSLLIDALDPRIADIFTTESLMN